MLASGPAAVATTALDEVAAASGRDLPDGVGDEVSSGQLQLDDRPVALPAGVAAGSDGTEPTAVSSLDQTQMVEQLTEQSVGSRSC